MVNVLTTAVDFNPQGVAVKRLFLGRQVDGGALGALGGLGKSSIFWTTRLSLRSGKTSMAALLKNKLLLLLEQERDCCC